MSRTALVLATLLALAIGAGGGPGLAAPPVAADEIPDRPEHITKDAEEAIKKGVAWLAKNQSKDGSWRNQGGWGYYPSAMTGLAGLALVGNGNTPSRGKYAREVGRSVDYLIKHSHRNGLISAPQEEGRSMYGHGFSMLFLSQVLGMEEDSERMAELHKVLSRAVDLTARAQSVAGGWNYSPDSSWDEGSVTITQMQALRACRNAGVKVPKKTIQMAVKYLEKSANPDGGIRYRAQDGGGSRPPITAAAVACLYNAGEYDSKLGEKALRFCDKNISVTSSGGGHHYYTHLYLSQAYYQAGGKRWDDYFPEMRDWLVKSQSPDGSWQGDGVGKVYGTAIALIILQLPYKNLPIAQR